MYSYYVVNIMTPREKRYFRRNNIKRIEEQKNDREIRYKKRNLMRIEEDKKNSNNKNSIFSKLDFFSLRRPILSNQYNKCVSNKSLKPENYIFFSYFGF